MKNISIFKKLLTFMLFIGTLGVLTEIAISFHIFDENVIETTDRYFNNDLLEKKNEIEQHFIKTKKNIETIGKFFSVTTLFDILHNYDEEYGVLGSIGFPVHTKEYEELTKGYYNYFSNFIKDNGYYDIFLICAEDGHVMFTVAHEDDFGTNLKTGKYKETHLAKLWRQVINQKRTIITDYNPYEPSNFKQAIFVGTPVYKNNEIIGVIAVQLSDAGTDNIVLKINKLFTSQESFIIGKNNNNKYQLKSNKEKLSGRIGDEISDEFIIKCIDEQKTGQTIKKEYKGKQKYEYYIPLNIEGLNWGLFTTVKVKEIKEPIINHRKASFIFVFIIIIVLIIFSYIFARSFSKPITKIVEVANIISQGKQYVKINSTRKDEIGKIFTSFNTIVEVFQENEKKLQHQNNEYASLNEEYKTQNDNLKYANRQIELSEKKYKELIQNQGEGFGITNFNEEFTFANPAAEKIFGVEKGDLIGKNLIDFFDKEQFEMIKLQSQNRKNKQTNSYELTITRPDKQKRQILITASPQYNEYNEVKGAIGIFRDITEKKEAENALEKAKKEAENANRLKSEFLANMSHEIRTPMNAVLGFSEILKNKLSGNTEYQSFIDGIINGGKNLISLINDILDLSKIEAGQMEITPEPVNIGNLIKDIKQIFSVKTTKKDIQIILKIDPQIPETIMFDQTRIRQILFNLVGNAIKFTEKGTINISVKIDGDASPESKIDLFFEVCDTGIGIPKDQIDEIFEPFKQVKGQASKYEGTGLGLPISKRLVEAMSGRITVDSEVGKGSVFRIHFKNVVVPGILISEKFKTERAELNILFNKPIILIADDVESNRDIINFHLNELNCVVFEVENGNEIIKFLNKNTPDLIITDIQMPVMDGYEATKQIKKHQNFKSIPVIALTALAMTEQKKKYEDVFDDYLKKPICVNELINCLKKYLPYSNKEDIKIDEQGKKLSDEFAERINTNKKLPEVFNKILENEIIPLYEDVCDIMDIENCKELSEKIINTGKEFDIEPLTDFGAKLKSVVNNFQLEEIESLLETFAKIINKLKPQ